MKKNREISSLIPALMLLSTLSHAFDAGLTGPRSRVLLFFKHPDSTDVIVFRHCKKNTVFQDLGANNQRNCELAQKDELLNKREFTDRLFALVKSPLRFPHEQFQADADIFRSENSDRLKELVASLTTKVSAKEKEYNEYKNFADKKRLPPTDQAEWDKVKRQRDQLRGELQKAEFKLAAIKRIEDAVTNLVDKIIMTPDFREFVFGKLEDDKAYESILLRAYVDQRELAPNFIGLQGFNNTEVADRETTQALWLAINRGVNPSVHKGPGLAEDFQDANGIQDSLNPSLPITNVTRSMAEDFCRKYTVSINDGFTYRLPTLDEWKAMADYPHQGSVDSAEEELDCPESEPSPLNAYAWHNGNSCERPWPVARKQPNTLGIYDVFGNVWEIVADKKKVAGADVMIVKGGAYSSKTNQLTVENAANISVNKAEGNVGFRMVRVRKVDSK